MWGQYGLGGGMVEFVGHVGEEGSFGAELFDEGDGFCQMRVAGVGVGAQGIEDEEV